MSFFDDQEDAWFANNCQGSIEDYDGTEFYEEVKPAPKPRPKTAKKLGRKNNEPRPR